MVFTRGVKTGPGVARGAWSPLLPRFYSLEFQAISKK
jgi:hypothetical protein